MTGSIPPSLPSFDIAKPDRAVQTLSLIHI